MGCLLLSLNSHVFATPICSGKKWTFGKKAAVVGFDKIRDFYIKNQTLIWCDRKNNKYIASQSLQDIKKTNIKVVSKKITVFEKNPVKHINIPLTRKSRGRTTLVLYVCKKICSENINLFIDKLKKPKSKSKSKLKSKSHDADKPLLKYKYSFETLNPKKIHRDLFLPKKNSNQNNIIWSSSLPSTIDPKTGDVKRPYGYPIPVKLTAMIKNKDDQIINSYTFQLKVSPLDPPKCPESSIKWRDDLCWYLASMFTFFYGSSSPLFHKIITKRSITSYRPLNKERIDFQKEIEKDLRIIAQGKNLNSCKVEWQMMEKTNTIMEKMGYRKSFKTIGKQGYNAAVFSSILSLILFNSDAQIPNETYKDDYIDLKTTRVENTEITHSISYSSLAFDITSELAQTFHDPEITKNLIEKTLDERLKDKSSVYNDVLRKSIEKNFLTVSIKNYLQMNPSIKVTPPASLTIQGKKFVLISASIRSCSAFNHCHFTNFALCNGKWSYYDSMFPTNRIKVVKTDINNLPVDQLDAVGRKASISTSSSTLLLYQAK